MRWLCPDKPLHTVFIVDLLLPLYSTSLYRADLRLGDPSALDNIFDLNYYLSDEKSDIIDRFRTSNMSFNTSSYEDFFDIKKQKFTSLEHSRVVNFVMYRDLPLEYCDTCTDQEVKLPVKLSTRRDSFQTLLKVETLTTFLCQV